MSEKANKIKINATYKEIMEEVWGGAEKEEVTEADKVERVREREHRIREVFGRRPKTQKGKTNKRR